MSKITWDKNYAKNKTLADKALTECMEYVNVCKTNRSSKEMEWLDDYKMWSCQTSDLEMFHGRSNMFIPELHHQVESTVGQFQAAMFPNDQYIKCVAMKDTQDSEAQNIEQAVYYELDTKNNFPTIMERYNRQKVLYGTSPMKIAFEDIKKTIYVKDKKGRAKSQEISNPKTKWEVCDIYHTYAYPETVQDPADLQVVFEEAFMSMNDIKKNKSYVNVNDVSPIANEFMYKWVDTVRLAVQNLATASEIRPNSALITEFWLDFEIDGEKVPAVITIANYNTVLSIKRNPYWFQKPPYVWGRYLQAPAGEFYGRSLCERLRLLQAQMNDLANQTMDSMNYSLNPIALIDPGFAGDVNSFKTAPGAKWFASPQGVQFTAFPNVAPIGFEGMQQVRGMIQQFSDLGIQVAPQLSGKVRSASQANIVSQQQNIDTKNMIRSDITDVLVPACHMTHILLQQFMNQDYMIKVQGPANGEWIAKEVKVSDLVGNVDYIWLGSDFANKDSVKNQQLIAFFDKALQIEQILPKQVDLPALYKIVAKKVFDIPMKDVFIKDKESFTVDPEIENIALMAGKPVQINDGDNIVKHKEAHYASLEKAIAKKDDLAIRMHIDHIKLHEAKEMADKELQSQEARLEAMMMAEGNNQPQGGGGPNRPQGNPFQSQNPASQGQILQGMRPVE